MIRISLLHPSYNRPSMAYHTFCNWVNNAKNPSEIEYLIGLDTNDPSCNEYQNIFSKNNIELGKLLIDIDSSTCAIQALNRVASKISDCSELIVEICDDIDCFKDWDETLLKSLEGIDNFKEPKMVGTHDGLRDYGIVFTQPIMNRAAYNKLGFMIYPEYTSMFADNDFTQIARNTGWLINAPHILFKHKHYTLGLNPLDKTYSRRNNQKEWDYNQKIYQDRAKRSFDL